MPIEPDYEKLFSIIPKEYYEKLNGYIKRKLSSYPVDQDILSKILLITSEENESSAINATDLDFIIDLRKRFIENIKNIERHDKAAIAYLKIRDGKLLNIISLYLKKQKSLKNSATEKKAVEQEIRQQLGLSESFSSTDFKLIAVSKIPFVENFCFLGIELLKELAPLIPDIDSTNPLLYLLYLGGYVYDERQDLTASTATEIFKKGANKFKLLSKNILVSDEQAGLIGQKVGIISNKDVTSLAIHAMIDTDHEKLIDTYIQKFPTPQTTPKTLPTPAAIPLTITALAARSAPTYNQLEETCLELIEMMEDVLVDRYVPNFDGRRASTNLEVLYYTTLSLMNFWEANWPSFNEDYTGNKKP